MLFPVLALLAAQPTAPILIGSRIPGPTPTPQASDRVAIRVTSPDGVLYDGILRVGPNQGASYQQSSSQAAGGVCPPGTPYDRSERRQFNFNINPQAYQGGQIYRIDVSWGRPTPEKGCGESGTRTVQINQTVGLDAGETALINGDAGLRVELTRR